MSNGRVPGGPHFSVTQVGFGPDGGGGIPQSPDPLTVFSDTSLSQPVGPTPAPGWSPVDSRASAPSLVLTPRHPPLSRQLMKGGHLPPFPLLTPHPPPASTVVPYPKDGPVAMMRGQPYIMGLTAEFLAQKHKAGRPLMSRIPSSAMVGYLTDCLIHGFVFDAGCLQMAIERICMRRLIVGREKLSKNTSNGSFLHSGVGGGLADGTA